MENLSGHFEASDLFTLGQSLGDTWTFKVNDRLGLGSGLEGWVALMGAIFSHDLVKDFENMVLDSSVIHCGLFVGCVYHLSRL